MGELYRFQLNLMLVLSGICGTIAFFVAITKTIGKKRKHALLSMELGAMFLLMFDRFAYIYRGNTAPVGLFMTRISNFLVFFLTLFVQWTFNNYLRDLYAEQVSPGKPPQRLRIVNCLLILGELLLIVSQFTGLYYTFDAGNRYQRAPGFIVSYLIPLIIFVIQLSIIIGKFRGLRRSMRVTLLLFALLPLTASVIQLFAYGLSLINITLVGMVVLLYIFSLIDANETVERAKNLEIMVLRDEQEYFRTIFVQTAEALASAIDAKDKYTHGHSRRVAEYSEKIARISGLDSKSCDDVYFAALLHDVGKIGIPDTIINKEGRLTADEFAEIRKHPIIGKQILSSISRSPHLSVGATHHHERYDGKGYPDGLKGEEIPNIARIISVADAYDAMTSVRSYRDPLPQQLVREEFVKGTGTQFDPVYTKIMLHLIDLDSEYHMKERQEKRENGRKKELHFGSCRTAFSEGLTISDYETRIQFRFKSDENALTDDPIPSVILYDSLDGKVHVSETKKRDLLYFEYCEIRLDGRIISSGARKVQCFISELLSEREPDWKKLNRQGIEYEVTAVRCKDHMRLRIKSAYQYLEFIIAFPDNSRFCYLSFTGQNCVITNMKTVTASQAVGGNEIPRIAEEISYINVPAGDIPNLQIDGWRSAATAGIVLKDQITLRFHSMSLPTARLIWHCPFVVLYSADDRQVGGKNYHEYALIRLDGECWEADEAAQIRNATAVTTSQDFISWENWKARNKEGIACRITVQRKGNSLTTVTEAAGITSTTVTELSDGADEICAALTGDQCALTDIRITGGEPCP